MNTILNLFYISITMIAFATVAVIVGHWIAYIIIKLFVRNKK